MNKSFLLYIYSGCVEDVPIENREGAGQTVLHPVLPASVTQSVSKTASLPRHSSMSPQWPTLQGGSIVSDYLKNLHIVSLFCFLFFPLCTCRELLCNPSVQ